MRSASLATLRPHPEDSPLRPAYAYFLSPRRLSACQSLRSITVRRCLGSEFKWTRKVRFYVRDCHAGLIHALSTVPVPSDTGGAVGKGWISLAPLVRA